MSSVHTTAPTSPQASHGAARHSAGTARQNSGNPTGADLFSSLLSLLSAAQEAPALDVEAGEDSALPASQDPTQATDGRHNPLADLLGWSAMPLAATTALAPATDPVPTGASLAVPDGTARPAEGSGLASAWASLALAPTERAPGGVDSGPGGPGGQPGNPAAPSPGSVALAPQAWQGMAPVPVPTAPDADTLAALARATPPAATGSPVEASRSPLSVAREAAPSAGNSHPGSGPAERTAPWRSTVSPVASATLQALNATDGASGARQAQAVHARSTVALNERFGQMVASEPAAATPASPVSVAPVGGTQLSGGGDPGSPGHLSDAGFQAGGQETPNTPTADATGYADAAREAEDTSTAHWGTPELRHASLRLGEGTEEAIDIQLSMAGQEVQVDFRTDNADARASLAQDASGSLGELLQRSGIQLGGVSVGAQNQQQGQAPRGQEPAPASRRGSAGTDGSSGPGSAPPPVQRTRSDGSQPLDLFV